MQNAREQKSYNALAEQIRTAVEVGACDLHLHSDFSDGSESPAAIVQMVLESGLRVFSITDHDTVEAASVVPDLLRQMLASQESASAAEKSAFVPVLSEPEEGPQYIPGVELSTEAEGEEVHLLGYFPTVAAAQALQPFLGERSRSREARNARMLAKLQELGFAIHEEELLAYGQGQIGRPHMARWLLEHGAVDSISEAFERYLKKGRPAFVPRENPPFATALRQLREVGALAALAHPQHYRFGRALRTLLPFLQRYIPQGLAGIEVFHGDATAADRLRLGKAAHLCGLIATAGSDWHGAHKSRNPHYTGASRFFD